VPKYRVRANVVYPKLETHRDGKLVENGLVVGKDEARAFDAFAGFHVEPETEKQVDGRSKAGAQEGEDGGIRFFCRMHHFDTPRRVGHFVFCRGFHLPVL